MISGEVLNGKLIWLPPSSGISTTLITAGNTSATATSVSMGKKVGMYTGALVGNKGATMRVELLCNAWTGKCFGSNSGELFDITK